VKNRKRLMILIPASLLVAVLAYMILVRSDDGVIIRVSGNIEVTDAEVSFKIPGRVEARLVDEGETVKAGQAIARLDSAELTQEVAARKAEVQGAQAALAELEAGSRPEEIAQAEASAQQAKARLDEMLAGSRPEELSAAEAVLRRARAEAERARLDAERYEGLYKKQIVSAQQYDAARTAYETALARQHEVEEQLKLVREGPRKEQIEQVRAAWLQAQERFVLVRKGPRQETIEQARARLRQAQEGLAVAETRLGYATLASPLTGVVLSKSVEPGEFVAAGTPIVTVGDLENVWLRAYIDETDLGRVKVGQRVRVTTDTYPDKRYEGRVSFIASQAEFTPRNVQTEKERVKLVYRIKVDIRNPNMELKPGMPADAEILLKQKGT
jgi:HlyD family secretion protein